MPRITPLTPNDVPELSEMLTKAEEQAGYISNAGLTLAWRPDIAKAVGNLVNTIYAPGDIDPGLKRLIGEATSKAAGCFYCAAHTAHSAHKAGVSKEKIEAVWNYQESPEFNDAERAAIHVAMRAGMTPNAVTDEDFEVLKIHYNEKEIVEIVAVIAMFGFLNRWNSTLATELESMPASFANTLSSNA
ncbi:MAG: carboxymuconolactone decarboxylase family protein [Pseudomonadota bacterium]